MNGSVLRLLGLCLGAAAIAGSVGAWLSAVPAVRVEDAPAPPSLLAPAIERSSEHDSAAAVLRDRNPFRMSRGPTTVRFGTEQPEAAVPEAPKPAPPTLSLAGLVGGPPWNVVVEGIPGTERGVLLLMGEESHGIRIVRVQRDTVVLEGLDTTWILTPRRPW